MSTDQERAERFERELRWRGHLDDVGAIAIRHGTSIEDIGCGESSALAARREAIACLRKKRRYSSSELGRIFGIDHTTASAALFAWERDRMLAELSRARAVLVVATIVFIVGCSPVVVCPSSSVGGAGETSTSSASATSAASTSSASSTSATTSSGFAPRACSLDATCTLGGPCVRADGVKGTCVPLVPDGDGSICCAGSP